MAQKNLIGLMVHEGLIAFVHIDKSVFKKSKYEKLELKRIKLTHKRKLKSFGLNTNKVFNLTHKK